MKCSPAHSTLMQFACCLAKEAATLLCLVGSFIPVDKSLYAVMTSLFYQ